MNFVDYNYDPDAASTQDTSLSVAFPVPQQIMSKEDLRFNQTDLGTLGAGVADGVNQLKQVFEAAGGSGGSEANKAVDFTKLSGDAVAAGGALLRNNAPGGVGAGISTALGNVVNPHVALLFEGVNLKNCLLYTSPSPRDS